MLSRATCNIVRRSLYNNAPTLYCLPSILTYDSSAKQHNIQDRCSLYVAKRFKSGRKKKMEEYVNNIKMFMYLIFIVEKNVIF